MWVDPIEMAAIRGENQKEANRRGISLQELLKEQRDKRENFCSKEKLKTPYPKYKENYENDFCFKEKIKNKIVKLFSKTWELRK